jgi:cell division septation protein DedD
MMMAAAVMFFVASPAFPAPDPDAEAGLEALRAGNVAEAKARFEAVIKRDPSNHDAALRYASILPAKDALKMADSLSRVQSAPGWAKAKSLRFLGDHRFTAGDYKKAADFYQQALSLHSVSEYKYLHALSIAAAGCPDAVRDILAALAADKSDAVSAEAEATFALIWSGSIPAMPTNPQPAASVDKPTAQPPAPVDKPAAPPVSADKPTAPQPVSPDKPPVSNTVFTIQVGAFGSKENADNLVKKLTVTYSDVTVSPTTSGDQTLYRVRVGTFQSRDDAITFANKLTESGMTARVVEK